MIFSLTRENASASVIMRIPDPAKNSDQLRSNHVDGNVAVKSGDMDAQSTSVF